MASVAYGLAPEHPFPAALNDAYEALAWLAENGPSGGDPERLAVAGESAGGDLAAALALVFSGSAAVGSFCPSDPLDLPTSGSQL